MAKMNPNEMNNIEDLQMWISQGQEVGFTFQDRSYCISYGTFADGQSFISLTEIGGDLAVSFIDIYEFMTYARVQNNLVAKIWPVVTDIKLFVPKEANK